MRLEAERLLKAKPEPVSQETKYTSVTDLPPVWDFPSPAERFKLLQKEKKEAKVK